MPATGPRRSPFLNTQSLPSFWVVNSVLASKNSMDQSSPGAKATFSSLNLWPPLSITVPSALDEEGGALVALSRMRMMRARISASVTILSIAGIPALGTPCLITRLMSASVDPCFHSVSRSDGPRPPDISGPWQLAQKLLYISSADRACATVLRRHRAERELT